MAYTSRAELIRHCCPQSFSFTLACPCMAFFSVSSELFKRGKLCLNHCAAMASSNLCVSSNFLWSKQSSSFKTWPHELYSETCPPGYKETSVTARPWTIATSYLREKKNRYLSDGKDTKLPKRLSGNFEIETKASQGTSKYKKMNFQTGFSKSDEYFTSEGVLAYDQVHAEASFPGDVSCHLDYKDENPVNITNGGAKINRDPLFYSMKTVDLQNRLREIRGEVHVIDNVYMAKKIVWKLTHDYRDLVYACDMEVTKLDIKRETPVDHGEIICFSIYSGPQADFGNGRSCIWVDVLDGGGQDILIEFAPFFEDPGIKKVWHNYSFDNHVIGNYGIRVAGFHADTMHMARLWDSSRRTEGGYSLEALSKCIEKDPSDRNENDLIGKVSMKTIFGGKKLNRDGSEGKIIIIPPVEELQRNERELWICYSALDSISTLKLYENLNIRLKKMAWKLDGLHKGDMFDFYEFYWRPFGELLVKMETEGMLVNREYLAEIEKVAMAEQQAAGDRFRSWASKYCSNAKYMNVGSDIQLRQLFYGGIANRKKKDEILPTEKLFRAKEVTCAGDKSVTKWRYINLHKIVNNLPVEVYTATGWPSICEDSLKTLAGKVSVEYTFFNDKESTKEDTVVDEEVIAASTYGSAYKAFGQGKKGREACHAIASLCQVRSIDSLISNFILPLQERYVAGKDGRIHCSLNINTETGRLSARRPSLQNQPALEKDRYMIRKSFIAAPGNSLVVADYGQLELRILAHLADCKSMLEAFKAGGDFHSRTAMNMYPHICQAVEQKRVLLECEDNSSIPLLKDVFTSERRKAKMLNFSIAYGITPIGLARDLKVPVEEARETVSRWYSNRQEVLTWQEERKREAHEHRHVHTLLGRSRMFPSLSTADYHLKSHIERASINTPVQGSAADVTMCAMLEISKNECLKELGWRLLLQIHDEVILEGPSESAEIAKSIVVQCMRRPFNGENILKVDLAVDAKCAQNWYSAK